MVSDHLEQSERVILDFVNAYGTSDQPADVSSQQHFASDLISTNRLYRDAINCCRRRDGGRGARRARTESPRARPRTRDADAWELDQVRLRLDAAALLFRVRVLSEGLRERELAPPIPRKTI